MSLLEDAKEYVAQTNLRKGRRRYNDEEIDLAVAWFWGKVPTQAVAAVLKVDKSNVGQRCSTAIRQGLSDDKVNLTRNPKLNPKMDLT